MRLNIEYIDPKALNPYPGNAKLHPAEQIEQIKKSIVEFGFNDPIAIWGKDNTIIEGHGRLVAAEELCMEKVPVIRLDNLTDEQRRAYTLVHNKLTMNTDFSFDLLQMELDEINDIDMAEFGFESVPDYLDIIGNDEFRTDNEPQFFAYTLTIPNEYKEAVDRYTKENGKQKIVDFVIEEAQNA